MEAILCFILIGAAPNVYLQRRSLQRAGTEGATMSSSCGSFTLLLMLTIIEEIDINLKKRTDNITYFYDTLLSISSSIETGVHLLSAIVKMTPRSI